MEPVEGYWLDVEGSRQAGLAHQRLRPGKQRQDYTSGKRLLAQWRF